MCSPGQLRGQPLRGPQAKGAVASGHGENSEASAAGAQRMGEESEEPWVQI